MKVRMIRLLTLWTSVSAAVASRGSISTRPVPAIILVSPKTWLIKVKNLVMSGTTTPASRKMNSSPVATAAPRLRPSPIVSRSFLVLTTTWSAYFLASSILPSVEAPSATIISSCHFFLAACQRGKLLARLAFSFLAGMIKLNFIFLARKDCIVREPAGPLNGNPLGHVCDPGYTSYNQQHPYYFHIAPWQNEHHTYIYKEWGSNSQPRRLILNLP